MRAADIEIGKEYEVRVSFVARGTVVGQLPDDDGGTARVAIPAGVCGPEPAVVYVPVGGVTRTWADAEADAAARRARLAAAEDAPRCMEESSNWFSVAAGGPLEYCGMPAKGEDATGRPRCGRHIRVKPWRPWSDDEAFPNGPLDDPKGPRWDFRHGPRRGAAPVRSAR